MNPQPCECEHISHMDDGLPAEDHPYFMPTDYRIILKTDYGDYRVCQHCANTHAKYLKEE